MITAKINQQGLQVLKKAGGSRNHDMLGKWFPLFPWLTPTFLSGGRKFECEEQVAGESSRG